MTTNLNKAIDIINDTINHIQGQQSVIAGVYKSVNEKYTYSTTQKQLRRLEEAGKDFKIIFRRHEIVTEKVRLFRNGVLSPLEMNDELIIYLKMVKLLLNKLVRRNLI